MELAILIWAIGTMFTMGFLRGVVHDGAFRRGRLLLIILACPFIWPAIIGATVGIVAD